MLHEITIKKFLILVNILQILGNKLHQYDCYDLYGNSQLCVPPLENIAYNLRVETTNTCDDCVAESHGPDYLTDNHIRSKPTWWQSKTMFDGVQHPNQVDLTLEFGKSYDINYIRIVFYSPRPESMAIYKREVQNGTWVPYQYYSATCLNTYHLPDSLSIKNNVVEASALCTSEYSNILPHHDGSVAFSPVKKRRSAYNFDNSTEFQNWVTATDIKVTLNRLNTLGDDFNNDPEVLRSNFYAISDIAVWAHCKCNGHSNKCIDSTGLNGMKTRICTCKHFTDGPDCERCLAFYNDAPWGRATSTNAHDCKRCNCNGFSNKCHFDSHLYNLTGHGGHCEDCTGNRDGPNCERCKENYYMRVDGDCVKCECDQIGSNSFQCNTEGKCKCKYGVAGNKCDRCADNYYNFGPNGCSCKENVEQLYCRECKPGYFNLDINDKLGCTPCSCYGHAFKCETATGYSIVSTLSDFDVYHKDWKALTDRNEMYYLRYSHFSETIKTTAKKDIYLDDIYFYAPGRFLGNQRASYKGLLKFKLHLSKQIAPSPSPNDVILEGAGKKISLPISAQHNLSPDNVTKEFSFRLHENPEYSWQPSQTAHGFMSILSNLTAIKIRASYSTYDFDEAYLGDFELQRAIREAVGQPATWIEQCTCPIGYLGQFCEACAPGYRRSSALGGPFIPCIPCNCNKHAEICDPQTGRCICQQNTVGNNCDQCAPGYYGNATAGTPYDCKKCPCPQDEVCMKTADESVICGCNCNGFSNKCFVDEHGSRCEECTKRRDGSNCEKCVENYYMRDGGDCVNCDCDPLGSSSLQCKTEGRCQCKHGVTGDKCDHCDDNYHNFGPQGCNCKENIEQLYCRECKPGFFNLDKSNELGCTQCFCFGHSSECGNAKGYYDYSLLSLFNFDWKAKQWSAVTDSNYMAELTYNKSSQNIGTKSRADSKNVYFSAPGDFLGNQMASYDRFLIFKIHLVDQISPKISPNDVILEGAGTKISLSLFSQNYILPDSQVREFAFRLNENPEYSWKPSQSFHGFKSILFNLTAIKIRGTYSDNGEAYLDDFELQTAIRGSARESATGIEQCTCPLGYLGQFCEACAPGYHRSPASGGPFMSCVPCDCNKHAEICDSETGVCDCEHDTTGNNCDQCAPGYYGNALAGTSFDCEECPCPGDCIEKLDDVICIECPVGYIGQHCDACASGYHKVPVSDGQLNTCIPCDCNNHAEICDPETGVCDCEHDTTGNNCEICAPGYYGNALAGTPFDCEECPCFKNCMETLDGVICIECPVGYMGQHCKACAPGYRKVPALNEPFTCIPCGCSKHAEMCDPETGLCICQHNTAGNNCDQCAPGYYGNTTAGKPDDCKKCPCPEDVDCKQNVDESVICIECPLGHLGQNCDACATGYYKVPALDGSLNTCKPCGCNKHSEICDTETGGCICQHNTIGNKCDQCAPGYYGNATAGTPFDCKRCPCPEFGVCMQNVDESVMCIECPFGYLGQLCEVCAPGYHKVAGLDGSFNTCIPCDCNEHAEICDPETGRCICRHNTAGKNCNQCAPGYYGNALTGTPFDCKRCPCPEYIACMQNVDEDVICLE